MAMPKNITLINVELEHEKKLPFEHALALLLLDNQQGRETYKIKGKYEFNGTDIIRTKIPRNSNETE